MDLSSIARNVRFQQHLTLTACWIWTGPTRADGTTIAVYDGIATTARSAIYRTMRGGQRIDRTKAACRNSLCVNPNHMEPANA